MNESVKVNTQASFLRTASQTASALRMELRSAQSADYSFFTELRFAEGANDGKDVSLDAPVMAGSGFYFTMPVENENMILNTMAALTETRIIPLDVNRMSVAGSFEFKFNGISTFPAQTSIFIRDNVNGSVQDLRIQPVYAFEMSSLENGNGRFELVISPEIVTATDIRNNSFGLSVYPNPVTAGQFFIELPVSASSSAAVMITDMLGKVVMNKTIGLESGKAGLTSASLANGIYTLKVSVDGKSYTRRISIQ
jgi:hypothetical protein